jgi:ribosomal protein L29
MNQTFQCGDNTALVSYLYDESEPAERAAIDAHVTVCAACTAELAALRSARLQLASWTPPDMGLGFQIVRPQASGLGVGATHASPLRAGASGLAPSAWWNRPFPVWAQAAAAGLIFAAGLALGVVGGSLPGSAPSASQTVATTIAAPAAGPTVVSNTELADLERRLRAEMAQLRTARVTPGAASPQGISEAQLLARVRTLIEESEQRQQRELALRTAQVVWDFDSQRKVDLAQISRSFGQIEGLTGAEAREQREMLNYLMRVSEQR